MTNSPEATTPDSSPDSTTTEARHRRGLRRRPRTRTRGTLSGSPGRAPRPARAPGRCLASDLAQVRHRPARSPPARSSCSLSRPRFCSRSCSIRRGHGSPAGILTAILVWSLVDPAAAGTADRVPAAAGRPGLPHAASCGSAWSPSPTAACSSSTSPTVPSTEASASHSSSSSPRRRRPASSSRGSQQPTAETLRDHLGRGRREPADRVYDRPGSPRLGAPVLPRVTA